MQSTISKLPISKWSLSASACQGLLKCSLRPDHVIGCAKVANLLPAEVRPGSRKLRFVRRWVLEAGEQGHGRPMAAAGENSFPSLHDGYRRFEVRRYWARRVWRSNCHAFSYCRQTPERDGKQCSTILKHVFCVRSLPWRKS